MLPSGGWEFAEYPGVIAAFHQECGEGAWKRMLISLSFLHTKGPMAGPLVTKKLKNGGGIWELIASYDSLQPRLLFYFDARVRARVVFVYGFIKQRDNMYLHAIQIAQKRRTLIEADTVTVNKYGISDTVH